jgi:hypothetical protein
MIATMLDHGWAPETLYPLVTGHGLPAATWGHAAACLSDGWDERAILLSLWDRRYAQTSPT